MTSSTFEWWDYFTFFLGGSGAWMLLKEENMQAKRPNLLQQNSQSYRDVCVVSILTLVFRCHLWYLLNQNIIFVACLYWKSGCQEKCSMQRNFGLPVWNLLFSSNFCHQPPLPVSPPLSSLNYKCPIKTNLKYTKMTSCNRFFFSFWFVSWLFPVIIVIAV